MKFKKNYLYLLLFVSSISYSQTVNNNLKTSAMLQENCILLVSNIDFGTYNNEVHNFASGSINVLCNKNTSYSIGINYYLNGFTQSQSAFLFKNSSKPFSVNSGTFTMAAMYNTNSTDYLLFNLFQDSTYTKIFGDANGLGFDWSGLGSQVSVYKVSTGEIQKTTIYAASPSGQFPKPGSYNATYGVNVTF